MQGSATGVVGTELRLTPSAADAVTVTVCPPWAALAPPDTGPSPPGRASVPLLPSPPPVGCPLPCVPVPSHSAFREALWGVLTDPSLTGSSHGPWSTLTLVLRGPPQ